MARELVYHPPVGDTVGGDRDVSDRSIEPDVENLVFEALQGDSGTPDQVPSNAAHPQPVPHPRVGHLEPPKLVR